MNHLRSTTILEPVRDWQRPLRVLTYSHDSFGLGHLRRSITLARAMVERGRNVQALGITGSPVPDVFPLPNRCELIKLPTIGKDAQGNYISRRLPLTFGEITRLRSDLITAAARAFRPDIFLVDHTANGPGGELLPVLRRLRHENMNTRVVLGMRDVLDAPVRARAEFARNGTFDLIRSCYDQVIVYGQPEVLDLAEEYGLPDDIAARIRYVGAVVPPEARPRRQTARGSRLRVLVTAGGGEDGYELLRGAVAAVRGPLRTTPLDVTLVTGPLMDEGAFADLKRAVRSDSRCTLVQCSRAMHELMDNTDLVVGMGGYNTVYETLARGLPLLVLPRRGPRQEQWERCRRLAAIGALHLMSNGDASDPHRFAGALTAAAAAMPSANPLTFDGADRTADFCLQMRRVRTPIQATAH